MVRRRSQWRGLPAGSRQRSRSGGIVAVDFGARDVPVEEPHRRCRCLRTRPLFHAEFRRGAEGRGAWWRAGSGKPVPPVPLHRRKILRGPSRLRDLRVKSTIVAARNGGAVRHVPPPRFPGTFVVLAPRERPRHGICRDISDGCVSFSCRHATHPWPVTARRLLATIAADGSLPVCPTQPEGNAQHVRDTLPHIDARNDDG